MADRVLVFASNPGCVRAELPIALARPREVDKSEMRGLIDQVYGLMTAGTNRPGRTTEKEAKLQLGDRLPQADMSRIEGVLEMLVDEPYRGRADLPKLGEETDLTDTELLEVSSALALLGFANLAHGDITITPLGEQFAGASNVERQAVFGRQLLEHVPLIAYICHGLEQDRSGDLPEDLFLKLLRFTLNEDDAESALRVAIEWGRFANLFEYTFNTGTIHLPRSDADVVA